MADWYSDSLLSIIDTNSRANCSSDCKKKRLNLCTKHQVLERNFNLKISFCILYYRESYAFFHFFGGHQLNVTIFIIVNLNFKQSLNFSLAILKLNSPDRTPASVPTKKGGNFEVNLLYSFIRGNLYHKFFGWNWWSSMQATIAFPSSFFTENTEQIPCL